jgi:glycosyltransferase involved in cell wall biosynthesis
MSVPALSVLMTAYNRERYIGASIESALAQTFENFELLVVDDGSTDRSVEIAQSLAARDRRIRIVVNERNLGQFANRNHAAALARAPLIKYHDSDDVMYPHCLEVMVGMLRSEPRAAFGLTSGTAWDGGPCPMLLTPRMAYQREYLGAGMFHCGPSGAIFNRAAFQELGGFEDVGVPSDYWFWLRACARVDVLLLPADLFWYRMHSGQELQSARGQDEYARVFGWSWHALFAPECPLTADEREQAKRNRVHHLAKRTLQDVRRGRFRFARNRLRASGVTTVDWIRYLRRPRRDPFAGTPRDVEGEVLMPSVLTASTPRPVHAEPRP